MEESSDTLLAQALQADDAKARRTAFVALVHSPDWRLALAPHVVSCQGYSSGSGVHPDLLTFQQAALSISKDDEKLQRSIELLGCRFSDALFAAVAQRMRSKVVPLLLQEMSEADSSKRLLLLKALGEADPRWVAHELASEVIHKLLQSHTQDRSLLISMLGQASMLQHFADDLRRFPPVTFEEWSALGRRKFEDTTLSLLARAVLPHAPGSLCYLLRLGAADEDLQLRILAAARDEWTAAALEVAIVDGLGEHSLIPLANRAIGLGGRSLAAATAWITSSKLGKQLLLLLAKETTPTKVGRDLNALLGRTQPSASPKRALQRARSGKQPDPHDLAALARDIDSSSCRRLVNQIVAKPSELLLDPVLRLLCAVNQEAAYELKTLARDGGPNLAATAKACCDTWRDIIWPDEDSTQEIVLP